MHEEYPRGHPRHVGYRRLAKTFGVSRTTASNLCRRIKRPAPDGSPTARRQRPFARQGRAAGAISSNPRDNEQLHSDYRWQGRRGP
jgi:hypothetical protein